MTKTTLLLLVLSQALFLGCGPADLESGDGVDASQDELGAGLNRFSQARGFGQPVAQHFDIVDAINDAPNHHGRLARVGAQVPTGGNWAYGRYDEVFAAAKAKNVQVMLDISYSPRELVPGATPMVGEMVATWPRAPQMQDRWVAYAMKLITHVQEAHPGVLAAIEWCNEPNGRQYGANDGRNPIFPEQYVSLLRKTYVALKAKYPSIISVTGGTAPQPTLRASGGGYLSMRPRDWYPALKAAGARPGTHFDHIANHFYDASIDSDYSAPFDELWSVWSGPQVWGTEEDRNDDDKNPNAVDWWKDDLRRWAGKGNRAGPFFTFYIYDTGNIQGGGGGLRTVDGRKKPQYDVYANFKP